ncbi:Dps family protein [Gilvibacter sp. SZ-19]|jgi:starvation-inducible DNA-binding protein|uniref:Dps family protein n=1 Tax=unclassified Gilvibacter TaxID=2625242 RepID=UPI000B3D467E|nr:DNA starvation/stationary phase protection protein [Gilvibacter sp. SZ-19]ARV12715.1 DNA starvation/stationary phase protection protein [Gilvibacter sp. SZ-19]
MNYLNMNDEKLLPVVIELNTLLAEYHIYYQKLRNYHWNILGKNFFDLHDKFEELYGQARIRIDEIAERILTLRYHPVSKYSDYLRISKLEESESIKTDREMVISILNDHRMLLAQMRTVMLHAENAKDEGTLDMLGAYIRDMEKASWMLNAWSKRNEETLATSLIEEA